MTELSVTPLKRALTLRDLVLFNLVAVTSITALSTTARTGPGVLTVWLLGALLFFIPHGLAVVELASRFPDEGGIYAWTKREFGDGHAFLCGWCYWICNVMYFPGVLLAGAAIATYAVGRGGSALADNWVYLLSFTLGALYLATVLNVVGLGTGKWLQNAGGVAVYVALGTLVVMGVVAVLTRPPANPFTGGWWIPRVPDFSTLNLWATIPFSYAGLELASTMGSEIRDPQRTLPRSIYVAAPLIAGVQILGAVSLLWLVPAGDVNVVTGVFQGIASGAGHLGRALLLLAPLAAAFATVGRVGAVGAWLSGSARVAFVVGLDRYFPPAFGRVHPRWRTPYVAILVATAISTAFLLLAVLGKGTTLGTAFLTLLDMSLLLYFIPYLYLFACYVAHCRRAGTTRLLTPGGRPAAVAFAVAGISVTLFSMIVATIPPPDTANPFLFIAKVVGGTVTLIVVAGGIYLRGRSAAAAERLRRAA